MKDAAASAAERARRVGWALAAALVLGGCLPASAQTLFLPARPVTPSAFTFSARFVPPPMLVIPSDSIRLAINASADSPSRNRSSMIESTADSVQTPFVQQTQLPLARFAGGRLELGGFDTLRPVENFLLGPPASGRLAAWSAGLQTHPAVQVPLSDESFGLSLSIHRKRDLESEHPVQVWRCLGWVVGAGRGCHLN